MLSRHRMASDDFKRVFIRSRSLSGNETFRAITSDLFAAYCTACRLPKRSVIIKNRDAWITESFCENIMFGDVKFRYSRWFLWSLYSRKCLDWWICSIICLRKVMICTHNLASSPIPKLEQFFQNSRTLRDLLRLSPAWSIWNFFPLMNNVYMISYEHIIYDICRYVIYIYMYIYIYIYVVILTLGSGRTLCLLFQVTWKWCQPMREDVAYVTSLFSSDRPLWPDTRDKKWSLIIS